MPIGQIIGAIGSLFGQRQEHKQQQRNIQDQLNADKQLAEYAYGKDLEQWQRANEYNSPDAQMSRLRDAGLNPKLVYGSGSAAGNTAQATSPKYQQVRSDYSKRQAPLNALAALGAYQDFIMKNAQIDLVNQQSKLRQAEAESAGTFYGSRAERQRTGYMSDQLKYAIQSYRKDYDHDPQSNWVKRTQAYKRYQSELGRTQHQAKQYEVGNKLKALELEWLNTMKSMGIGKGLGIPLLRLFMGK